MLLATPFNPGANAQHRFASAPYALGGRPGSRPIPTWPRVWAAGEAAARAGLRRGGKKQAAK